MFSKQFWGDDANESLNEFLIPLNGHSEHIHRNQFKMTDSNTTAFVLLEFKWCY